VIPRISNLLRHLFLIISGIPGLGKSHQHPSSRVGVVHISTVSFIQLQRLISLERDSPSNMEYRKGFQPWMLRDEQDYFDFRPDNQIGRGCLQSNMNSSTVAKIDLATLVYQSSNLLSICSCMVGILLCQLIDN
jgi:hypothetical protein